MILCDGDCIPCCDFCIYCIHANEDTEEYAKAEPIACSLYNDKFHNNQVRDCGYCDDFHCFRADITDL